MHGQRLCGARLQAQGHFVSLNSPSLRFVLLGSDTQIGMSLEQLFDQRQIPYRSLSVSELASVEALAAFLAGQSDKRFVVNCLFEESDDTGTHDGAFWGALNAQVIDCCRQHQQSLLTISSMRVFSGRTERSYHEDDSADADNVLGQRYRDLEQQVIASGLEAMAIRVDWLFSELLGNILTRLISAAVHQESLCISENLRGCPTDAHSVARVIVAMAEQLDCNTGADLSGIYHYADSDACSMYTFAKTAITIIKSMIDVRVEAIEKGDTAQMLDAVVAPESFVPSCQKILSTFGIKQRPWRRSVHEVLKKKLQAELPQV